ncbi:MAG: bifunctional UDP-N-acetylglucosamine diphosphorylase/glucosamine-1-phosphate N-acetyltransferase GlmU [Terriglobales bacterium]|jgi:bifunctional UDP-N-acetylglucosamine pyrophosphorylase/glucosamine-1-phosphate N-acetyltransferase
MANRKPAKPRPAANRKVAIAIMAAGKGTRLKSKDPKVLHRIGGMPLLEHVIAAAAQVAPARDIYAIVGHEEARVRDAVKHTGVNFISQAEQRGTGHAMICAQNALNDYDDIVVLSGDVPLIQGESIRRLLELHQSKNAAMTILTTEPANPLGYGRIIRKSGDVVASIVEQKALSAKQQKIKEINSGIYAFSVGELFSRLHKLTTENAHREFYLTDIAGLLTKDKKKVLALRAADADEVLGVNTRAELSQLDAGLRSRKALELMREGVTIFYPETCVIDSAVSAAPDVVIEPSVQLLGKTSIGEGSRISSYSVITNSTIGANVTVRPGCIITDSDVADSAVIGPYAHIRPGSEIGENAHVGNFVETKKTKLGKGSKANHLSYLGDSNIGDGVNVGAGTITCNYDGVAKHQTTIEDGVFVGSDSTLVAPITIGKGAYVGAGSTVTEDVPADALVIGRARQEVKPGWAKARREKQRSAAK